MRQKDRYARLRSTVQFSLDGRLSIGNEPYIHVSPGTIVLVEQLSRANFRVSTLDRPDYFRVISPVHFELWLNFMTPLEVLALELG